MPYSRGVSRPATPEDLTTVLRRPDLVDPVLLVHLEGWIDAAQCAATAVERILAQMSSSTMAIFDTEWLLDHRSRRPVLRIVDGVNAGIDWPFIRLDVGQDADGHDLLVLHGAEPDHNWRTFADAVVELAQSFGVVSMVGLGAYPAAAPHTRPARLSLTAASRRPEHPQLADVTLDVPAGVESVLEKALEAAGIPAVGLWAQVPHYVPFAPYPAAALALVNGLDHAAGLRFDTADLATEALTVRNRLDQLVRQDEEHAKMLAQIERAFDQTGPEAVELQAENLTAEIERFLRAQSDGETPSAEQP